ncbi:MAG: hypothetical protein ACR2FZ_06125 [Thermoleophilaceae bacterium]
MVAPPRCRTARRRVAALAIAAAALLGGGCGDDEGRVRQETVEGATTPTTPAETTPARTVPERERTLTTPADGATPPRAPEEEPGGAGDEQPASSQALLTGRAGRIGPVQVRVPPFIAIRVELRSDDGRPYALRFGKRVIMVDADTPSVSTTFDGLRPGRRLKGSGKSGGVVIEASAEPGP